jgi:hypothetical protein
MPIRMVQSNSSTNPRLDSRSPREGTDMSRSPSKPILLHSAATLRLHLFHRGSEVGQRSLIPGMTSVPCDHASRVLT